MIGKNFISGSLSSRGNNIVYSHDAITGEKLDFGFFEATYDEALLACKSAAEAFKIYRQTSLEQRALFLEKIAEEIDSLDSNFLLITSQETALPLTRLEGEKSRTCNQLRLFAEVLRRGDFLGARIDQKQEDRKPLPKPDIRQIKMGVGPIGVFGSSNFPLAFSVAGGDTASALAAGCPVVVKAHPAHMVTSHYIAEAINRAIQATGMPSGVFNMLYGFEAGKFIALNNEIKAIGFTGSLSGGRYLYDLASSRPNPIPVFAEMSSINPIVILPKSLEEKANYIAEQLTNSITMSAGQLCTKPGLIIGITSPEFTNFIQLLKGKLEEVNGQTLLHDGILQSYHDNINNLAKTRGFTQILDSNSEQNLANPQLFYADVNLLENNKEILQQEIFGPAAIIIDVKDKKALESILLSLEGQLTATLISEKNDLDSFQEIIPILEDKAGRLIINGYPTGVEVCDAMVHGGPYPSTTDARGTSVGTLSIERFLRPICYQNYPQELLPEALLDDNPLNIWRLVNGKLTKEPI